MRAAPFATADQTRDRPVIDHKTQIDQRPFRSKSDQQREVALQTQYHNLAIPEVVAALQIVSQPSPKASTEKRPA